MDKVIIFCVAAFVGFIAIAGIGAVGGPGGGFDYATAESAERQKFLDSVAKGFRGGFRLGAGKSAEITDTFTDESVDLISFSIQLKDERINDVPLGHIEKQRLLMLKKSCQQASNKRLLDYGVTMRMRFYKPGGAKLMSVTVNQENCAKYLA